LKRWNKTCIERWGSRFKKALLAHTVNAG
jgi:hypothetical protein